MSRLSENLIEVSGASQIRLRCASLVLRTSVVRWFESTVRMVRDTCLHTPKQTKQRPYIPPHLSR
jgi:hypothetical protein